MISNQRGKKLHSRVGSPKLQNIHSGCDLCNEVADAFDFMCFGFETFATVCAVLLLVLKTGLENEIYKIQKLIFFFLLDTVPAACTTYRPGLEFLLGHQRAAAFKKCSL